MGIIGFSIVTGDGILMIKLTRIVTVVETYMVPEYYREDIEDGNYEEVIYDENLEQRFLVDSYNEEENITVG